MAVDGGLVPAWGGDDDDFEDDFGISLLLSSPAGLDMSARAVFSSQSTPSEVFAWMFAHCSELMRAVLRRRRRVPFRGKCVDVERMQRGVMGEAIGVEVGWPVSQIGRDMFRAVLRRLLPDASGVRCLKPPTIPTWKAAPPDVKLRWYCLAMCLRSWGTPLSSLPVELGGRVNRMLPEARAPACLLTWHLNVGVGDMFIGELLHADIGFEELVSRMRNWRALDDLFDEFYAWIDQQRLRLGCALIGACFEIGARQRDPGRVHAHAFLSVALAEAAWGSVEEFGCASFVAAELMYLRSLPHMQPVRVRRDRGGRRTLVAISQGMYYVIARKEGQLRSRGNQTVEDCWHAVSVGGVCGMHLRDRRGCAGFGTGAPKGCSVGCGGVTGPAGFRSHYMAVVAAAEDIFGGCVGGFAARARCWLATRR